MEVLRTSDALWQERLKTILARMGEVPEGIDGAVRGIIDAVASRGDEALAEYTRRFDRFDPATDGFVVQEDQITAAAARVDPETLGALQAAASRIEEFHSHQKERSWVVTGKDGMILGQKVTPLSRAGVYIPGGRNAFPSTLLMNVIPAKIAGVEEIVVVSPTPDGVLNDTLLAAAHTAGIEKIYRIGGAQAVAALAYGTETVPGVDKIVGPGNIYVAHAKRLVQGRVGIDSFAGPSEILVIADRGADPQVVAMDLLSQAEHDPMASAILATPHEELAAAVMDLVSSTAETMPRKDVLEKSLRHYGLCIITRDLDEAFLVANMIAPEHLELMIENAFEHLGKVRNAGAIFLGYHTPEALGDYVAGPNHTLPTASTARFSSPLGVYDFIKRSSIISGTLQAVREIGPLAVHIARAEGLEAHARSVEMRLK
ncbi:MAG TPA: histidinol dehydrogenase [Deltaproteobacteria bacterium]|jgi:histidinol dehydrogenase|nr:histidinol dehydrogenase [Deltaproteobacteria bacterium]HOI06409.1 histidinol dehydrogenase [Deltaproteobacteria bacterium]